MHDFPFLCIDSLSNQEKKCIMSMRQRPRGGNDMLAFTIPDTKYFMGLLFKSDTFDDFCFRQGEISAFSHISIDGKRDMDYYEETDTEPWCSWAEIKPIVFQFIRGKKTPKNLKLVLSLSTKDMASYENTAALFWNILFRENTLLCTISTTPATFTLDKIDEQKWAEWVIAFCQKHNIGIIKEG